MGRPTIRDLADAAGVSVSTVNRVIGGRDTVREATVRRVLDAAEAIGFYGAGAIRHRVDAHRARYDLRVLLLQRGRDFYRALADALERAAAEVEEAEVALTVAFADDLSPDKVAARMRSLGAGADALAVVSAEHPRVSEALAALGAEGVAVFSLISPLSAGGDIGHVGLDHWKVGRTAAWAFERMCRSPGKIGILIGSHRYRNQETNESGFRSYFREHGAGGFELLEPLPTFESAAIAQEMTERLLGEHPDLAGLFVTGGGITGALAALRDADRAGTLVSVGYELMDATRTALLDGTLTLVIAHPLERLARETIAAMIGAKSEGGSGAGRTVTLPFEIYTPENL